MDRALNGVDVPVYSAACPERLTWQTAEGASWSARGPPITTACVACPREGGGFMLRNRAPDRFTEGRTKGLNAVGQMELKRLKKQWREEYERERAQGGEQRVYAAIDAKLNAARDKWLNALSPRARARAAYNAFRAIEAEDKAAGYRWWDDPEHPGYDEGENEDNGGDCL